MFGVGLQFHVKALLAVRRVAVPGAQVDPLVEGQHRAISDSLLRVDAGQPGDHPARA